MDEEIKEFSNPNLLDSSMPELESLFKPEKWRYECHICGARSIGEGDLIKSCDCKHRLNFTVRKYF